MDTDPAGDVELLYQGEWLRMVRRGHWESCERTHGKDGLAVLVIAVTPDDHVLFVEQYRVPLGARTIEMPAGLVGDDHDDDSLEAAARRELIEETGWEGMSNEPIAFARARDLRRVGDGGGVNDEDITVHSVPRSEAPAWLMQKYREGYELDLKLWAGLWMIEYNPDGTRAD